MHAAAGRGATWKQPLHWLAASCAAEAGEQQITSAFMQGQFRDSFFFSFYVLTAVPRVNMWAAIHESFCSLFALTCILYSVCLPLAVLLGRLAFLKSRNNTRVRTAFLWPSTLKNIYRYFLLFVQNATIWPNDAWCLEILQLSNPYSAISYFLW